MKMLFKLVLLLFMVAAIFAMLRPDSDVSGVVGAAIEDVSGFCDRQPGACEQGASIAYRTQDLIAAAMNALSGETPPRQPLTTQDRALAPPTDPDAAPAQQPAIATHGDPARQ